MILPCITQIEVLSLLGNIFIKLKLSAEPFQPANQGVYRGFDSSEKKINISRNTPSLNIYL